MRFFVSLCACLALPVTAAPILPDHLDDLPAADVVFLGEVHDNPIHHHHQERALGQIKPAALVFEMLTPDQAARLPDPLPPMRELQGLLDWDTSGWPDFAMYDPLFRASPGVAIYGAGLPREEARAAMNSSLPAIFAGDAARFGLADDLSDEEQSTREAVQARAHCDALPENLLPGMVAIQRLRDALLAEAALRAFSETGGPVAVITGTGHARTDWGAPASLARAAPELSILSIGQFEHSPDAAPPYDLWLVTDPHPRPDPCAAFQ